MRFWQKKTIPGDPRIGIGVACCFIEGSSGVGEVRHFMECLSRQTYRHWHVSVMHDGGTSSDERGEMERIKDRYDDGCFVFNEMFPRKKQHGHPWRQQALDQLMGMGCTWLMSTNADNYYMPVFLEALLDAGVRHDADVVYCDMVHSHQLWQPMTTKFEYRHLDLGGFIVRDRLARKIAFDNFNFNGDGDWINRLAAATTRERVVKVPMTLFVHN